MNNSAHAQARPWIGAQLIDRTRRNHGLEHATVNVLNETDRSLALAGRSTPHGFYIYGKVTTEQLERAANEALRRLQAGDEQLAIHANCGTNLLAKGLAAGLTSYFGFLGANTSRSRLGRLPRVAMLSSLALVAAQPLGLALQKNFTVSGRPAGLRIVSIRQQPGSLPTHFVATAG
jgi:hypothetical protein